MRTISVRISDDLFYAIENQSLSQSELIRQALKLYLSQKALSEKTSFLALAEDLCGIYEGPEDLSTNPKYMKGYGQ